MFGTIRMHQERAYPARVFGTALHNPDFAALAQAYGACGEVVTQTAHFAPALQRALRHMTDTGRPALIELRYDGNLITPGTTLEAIRRTHWPTHANLKAIIKNNVLRQSHADHTIRIATQTVKA